MKDKGRLSKTVGLTCNFIKKRLWHKCLPVNFAKFLRTPIFIEHLWWLLLPEYFDEKITHGP